MRETKESVEEQQSVFQEWAEVTTAHGFLDYSYAKTRLGKVIWFILILVCLLLMFYQLNRVFDDYYKHEWITTIKEKASDIGK